MHVLGSSTDMAIIVTGFSMAHIMAINGNNLNFFIMVICGFLQTIGRLLSFLTIFSRYKFQ